MILLAAEFTCDLLQDPRNRRTLPPSFGSRPPSFNVAAAATKSVTGCPELTAVT